MVPRVLLLANLAVTPCVIVVDVVVVVRSPYKTEVCVHS